MVQEMDTRARERMVRGQVRCWNVLDERVLAVFSDLRREDFVPSGTARWLTPTWRCHCPAARK